MKLRGSNETEQIFSEETDLGVRVSFFPLSGAGEGKGITLDALFASVTCATGGTRFMSKKTPRGRIAYKIRRKGKGKGKVDDEDDWRVSISRSRPPTAVGSIGILSS